MWVLCLHAHVCLTNASCGIDARVPAQLGIPAEIFVAHAASQVSINRSDPLSVIVR